MEMEISIFTKEISRLRIEHIMCKDPELIKTIEVDINLLQKAIEIIETNEHE